MEFGKKVQMLRKNQNLSQEKLATILKINRNYLSRIETGKFEPTLSVIRNIAKYFKIDIASFMDIEVSSISAAEKIKKINDDCHHLIDDDLDLILRLISVMREEYVKRDF